MLDVAIRYENEVRDELRSTWFDERYKYYAYTNYYEDWKPEENTWSKHEFVSLREGKVIGYMSYAIARESASVYGLGIINFEKEPSLIFAVDLGTILKDIFDKYCFRKLSFSVVVGNPIEKSYDKMCRKYGGRIVGTKKDHTRLIDGLFYDEKLYEILREDYVKRR